MTPLPFVWPYALVFWAVEVWAFLPEWKIVKGGREGGKRADSKDSGSMNVMLAGTGLATFLAYPLAFVEGGPFRACISGSCRGVLMVLLGACCDAIAGARSEYFTAM